MVSRLKKIGLFLIFLFSICLIQSVYAYDNVEHGFSITPPTGWSIAEDTGDESIVVMFRDPKLATVIYVIIDDSYEATLSQYIYSAKQYAPMMRENFSLVSEGPRIVGKLNGYQIDSSFIQDGEPAKLRQVVFVENHKAYVISYGSIIATEYSNRLQDFENSIDSFKITPTSQNDTTGSQDYTLIGVITGIAVVALVVIALFSVYGRKQKLKRMNNSMVTVSTLNSQIVNQSESTKFCRYCGMNNKKDAVFCEKCGQNIE